MDTTPKTSRRGRWPLWLLLLTACLGPAHRQPDGDDWLRGPCEDPATATPLAWEEISPLGVSPREAFAALEGSCEAPLSWRPSDGNPRVLSLPSQESTMRVQVRLDRASAQFVDTPGVGLACGSDSLALNAQVRFESSDGTFADEQRTTIVYRHSAGPDAFGFESEHGTLAGDLMIGSAEDPVSLEYRTNGPDALCTGEVALSVPSGRARAEIGSFFWSKTGCRSGLHPVALEPSVGRDMEVVRAIEGAFGDASYRGEWGDGTPATLRIGLQGSFESACEARSDRRTTLEVPVTLRYGSDDGRIVPHTSEARVELQLGVAGDILRLRLELSETLACTRVDRELPFGDETCADLSSVLARLSLPETSESGGEQEGWFSLHAFSQADPHGRAVRSEDFALLRRLR